MSFAIEWLAFLLTIKILARKPAIVTSVSRGFPQSFCREVTLNQTTTTSFHILFNS
jgi:hypothetical protein